MRANGGSWQASALTHVADHHWAYVADHHWANVADTVLHMQIPQCRKSVDNVVECRGLARTGRGVLKGDFFTLPEGRGRLDRVSGAIFSNHDGCRLGMRPSATQAFLTIAHDGAGHVARVDVQTNGKVGD